MIDVYLLEQSGLKSSEWDEYVNSSPNGTLFHTRKFLSYHGVGKFEDASLVFRKRDKITALLPATVKSVGNKRVFVSHPGASWGGFVADDYLKHRVVEELVSKLIKQASKLSCDRVELTLPPHIYQRAYQDDIPFVLIKNGFSYVKRELTSVVDLTQDLDTLVNRAVRKGVNKATRQGIEISYENNDWSDFYDLLTKTLEYKGAKPTHTLSELLRLKELFPESIVLWCAYLEGEMVGGMCSWLVNSDTWLVFYSAYNLEMTGDRILDLLFHSFIDYYKFRGYRYLDFGTSSLNMQVNRGLINFKEQFGGYGHFRDTLAVDL